MDAIFTGILLILLAYLLGSIPTAVWAGKWFFGIDLRDHGSGNAGATNAFRVLGGKTAIVVLLIDMLKGMAAVSLAAIISGSFVSDEWFTVYRFVLGLAALAGHVFPVFAGFRGGKGIATLAGIVILLFPLVMAACLAIFLLVFLSTRYVSLGSVMAALSFPVVLFLTNGDALLPEILFAILVAIFVPLTHIRNIRRLLRGEENKISFHKGDEKLRR
jgi:acyl phosphate:glycerol-3-phosphate acyltransferase